MKSLVIILCIYVVRGLEATKNCTRTGAPCTKTDTCCSGDPCSFRGSPKLGRCLEVEGRMLGAAEWFNSPEDKANTSAISPNYKAAVPVTP
ncbi:hypothetical protein C0J52_08356 [Blattella germanica]|nr:hypothetical protein C0J52_08356 [Blattella germanica]